MKKIFTIIATVGIVASSLAQMTTQPKTYSDRKLTKTLSFDMQKFSSNKNKTAAAVTGGWFNYGTAIDVLNAGIADLNSNYLFPDSLGYGEFGAGTFAPCWVHHLGDILDVKGVPFLADPLTTFTGLGNAYSVDSMSIVYAYTRMHPNPAIVDTLVVTLFTNNTASNLSGSGFIGTTAASYGTDTVSFKKIKYNQAANTVSATATTSYKILLTIADTAAAVYREKAFKLGSAAFVVPAGGKLLVADVQFKPGYTYTIGTHIDYVANAFFFTSYEEKGASTFPTYYDCNFGATACDNNSSHIVSQDVRYNLAGSWNGSFIPSYAYTAPYGFEHHLISYRLTETVGVNELEKNGFALGQNVPNPFTNGSAISYQLIKDAKSVVFTVTDVMGRVISTETASNATGIHTVNIGSYAAGVYYYSLNVDGNVITKKMIAQ